MTTAPMHATPFDIALLAGQRPGQDPLAAHFGEELKALVSVHGRPMLDHMLDILPHVSGARRIFVLAQQAETLADHMGAAWRATHPSVIFRACGPSISGTLIDLMAADDAAFPLLVTTVDNILLTPEIIAHFLESCRLDDADVVAGVVEALTLRAAYPANKRTWLKFRGGAYSGANLFWFASARALPVLHLWRTIEQDRKKGRAIIGAFGLPLLLGAGLRILSLAQALAIAGKRMQIRAKACVLPFAEAAIDVDKPADHDLATRILAQREAASR
jgi:GTP:adenosylcobinamide-phosphate guanylyltransferase